ncbi:MAG: hypothetical protein GXO27_03855 [Chlorobi bacterium]|nr:hypothetical protein [Chlorobiota bacterium]
MKNKSRIRKVLYLLIGLYTVQLVYFFASGKIGAQVFYSLFVSMGLLALALYGSAGYDSRKKEK